MTNPNLGEETGYHPYVFSLEESINLLLKYGQSLKYGPIKPNPIFLDLGAGTGGPMIEVAKLGFRAYGIELNPEVAEVGNKKIEKAKRKGEIPHDAICKLATGSYYPKEYIELREKGDAVAPKYETVTYYGEHSGDVFPYDHGPDKFHPVISENNPYEKLGIKLEDVDIFFSYTWGKELPSHLELLARYAKDEAILINDPHTSPDSKNMDSLLRKLRLRCKGIDTSMRYSLQMFNKGLFNIIVPGKWSGRDIGKLIRYCQLKSKILGEDDSGNLIWEKKLLEKTGFIKQVPHHSYSYWGSDVGINEFTTEEPWELLETDNRRKPPFFQEKTKNPKVLN